MEKNYFINDDYVNTRLDRWFKKTICEVPQSIIEKNIRKGNIKVNGKKTKSSYKLKLNDKISLKNINLKTNQHKKITLKYKATKKDL